LAGLGDVVDRKPGAEFLAVGDAIGEVVLEVAALAVVGLQRDDVGAVGGEQQVVRGLQLVRAGEVALPKAPVVHRLQVARVVRVEDRDAVAEHVADVDVLAVDHHLHRIGPPALVAVGDVLDALADALRRDRVGGGCGGPGRAATGQTGSGRQAKETFDVLSTIHASSYFSNSGAISFGRMSGISGNRMIAASISSIGTSMIAVSLSANLSGTFATAQEIIRHRPEGGVTSPKASETMPMMPNWIGCMR